MNLLWFVLLFVLSASELQLADIADIPPLEDRSQLAGIAAIHDGSWEEYSSRNFDRGYLAMGQAWGDYDNDGWVDLYVTGGLTESVLYHNDGRGTFSVSPFNEAVGLPDVWTGGAVWVDYDNDGWRDLYVLANGANVLLRNEAGAGFSDVTELAGVGDTGKGSAAAWGDYDNDGWLDLYVANWSCFPDCDPIDPDLAGDRLYRNQGNGTFAAVSRLMDEEMLRGAGFAAGFADFDNDGDLDIYVVNDKLQNPIGNVLWRNDGPGCGGWCFSERAAEMDANIVKHGMGLAIADYDNDLDLDIYFSDMVESMVLLQNRGESFEDVAEQAGVAVSTGSAVGWGTTFFDYNNDGWQDIFLATTEYKQVNTIPVGMLMPYPDFLYENNGDGAFEDVSPPEWRRNPVESMGAASADYDNDGQVDLVVGEWDKGYRLYRNTGSAGIGADWITVRLVGVRVVNRDAVGSRVTLELDDGRTLMQEVQIGSSFGAGNDTALHFGLGNAAIENLTVVWPNGWKNSFGDVGSNQVLSIVYGQEVLVN
jgi:hypothetical protein